MKIESITAAAFKGRSFKQPLAPITVLVGDNFAGKSSRAEALTLALAGYLPGIERLPGKIHERLASAPVMSVQADFEGGKFIRREYAKNGDGSVARRNSNRGLSANWSVNPVLVDAGEFLGLSENERVKFLFQNLAIQGEVVTPRALFDKLGKSDAANDESAVSLILNLDEEFTADHERAVTAGLAPQLWLERLVLDVGARKNDAVRALGVMEKGAQVENANRPELLALNPTAIKKALEDARKDLEAKQTSLNDARVARAAAQPALSDAEERQNVRMAESSLGAANEALGAAKEALASVQTLDCCPQCGAKNKGWRAKIEAVAKSAVIKAEADVSEAAAVVNKCGEALQRKQKMMEQARQQQFTDLDKAVEKAAAEFNAANEAHAKAHAEHRKLEAQQAEEGRRRKQQRDLAAASVKAEVYKAFLAIAQESLDGMVKASIGPFLERVNALCGGIMKAPVAYQDGELGMVKPSGFVTWRSFSKSERLLFTVAVQIALASEASIRVAILDDVGTLTGKNRRLVCERCIQLLNDHRLDNVIITHAVDEEDAPVEMARWNKCSKNFPGVMAVAEVKE
ncbi:MAG: hypothetical protein KGL39_02890 [Patescibacteria group bacterium]|nr:hypothetical protein [Patescibacteria group bacterium]